MQSLCALRDHCRQRSRNTRYRAGPAPYSRRSSTGWIAPACLAHSLDHLIGAGEDRWRDRQTQRVRRFQVDDQLEFGRLLDRQVGGLLALENAAGVFAGYSGHRGESRTVADQTAGSGKLADKVDRGDTMSRRHRWQLSTPAVEERVVTDEQRIHTPSLDRRESSLDIRFGAGGKRLQL